MSTKAGAAPEGGAMGLQAGKKSGFSRYTAGEYEMNVNFQLPTTNCQRNYQLPITN